MPAFGLTLVDLPAVSNQGASTFLVSGYGFDDRTTFALSAMSAFSSRFTSFLPTKTVILGQTQALVTFDLGSAGSGNADLIATNGKSTATLTDATVIEPAHTGLLQVALNAPAALRAGAMGQWTVNYTNAGETDIPVPLLRFRLPGALFLSTSPDGVNQGDTAYFLGIPDGPLTDVLRPGQGGHVTFYVTPNAALLVRVGAVTHLAVGVAPPPVGLGGGGPSVTANVDRVNPHDPAFVNSTFDFQSVINQFPQFTRYWNEVHQEVGDTLSTFFDNVYRQLDFAAANPYPYQFIRNINGQWEVSTPPITSVTVRPFPKDALSATASIGGSPGAVSSAAIGPVIRAAQGGGGRVFVVVVADSMYPNGNGNPPNLPGVTKDLSNVTNFFSQEGVPPGQITIVKQTTGTDPSMTPQAVTSAIFEPECRTGRYGYRLLLRSRQSAGRQLAPRWRQLERARH